MELAHAIASRLWQNTDGPSDRQHAPRQRTESHQWTRYVYTVIMSSKVTSVIITTEVLNKYVGESEANIRCVSKMCIL